MDYPNESTLKDLLGLLKRAALPALAVAILLAAPTYYLRSLEPASYEAEASLVLSRNSAPSAVGVTLLTSSLIDVSAYSSAVRSPAMLNEVLLSLGVEEPTSADRNSLLDALDVSVEQTTVSSIIYIRAVSTSPAESSRLANAVTSALIDWDERRALRSLDSIVETLDAQIAAQEEQIRSLQVAGSDNARINALLGSLNELTLQRDAARALRTAAVGRLEMLSPAVEPDQPLPKRQVTVALAAGLLGAFAVVAFYLIRNALDTRMRTSEDFTATTGVPVLAEFAMPRKVSSAISLEAANYLGASLLYGLQDSRSNTVMVCSSDPNEGAANVALGLAASLSYSAQSVLLIDADLRNPVSATALGLKEGSVPSFDSYLRNPREPFVPSKHRIGNAQTLHVVPSFRPVQNASALLVKGFRARLEEWSSSYDIVLLLAPPLLSVADGLIMAPYCSGALLVCNLRVANGNRVKRSLSLLERPRLRVFGAAVTGAMGEADGAQDETGVEPLGVPETPRPLVGRRR